MRTMAKGDLQASSAELVFGQPLRVPGEFIPSATDPWSASQHLPSLREDVRRFAPVPTSAHCTPPEHVPTDLCSAPFVFIRHDAHRGPLRPPYDGPFRVIEPGPKHFTVDVGGRPESISVDRLKPAHLDFSVQPDLAHPPRRGRPPRSVLDPNVVPFVPSAARHPMRVNISPIPTAPVQTRCGRVVQPPVRFR